MKVLALGVLWAFSLVAVHRNPFLYGDDFQVIACVSIGCLNNQEYFARVYLDGVFLLLRVHERYREYEVVSISSHGITLTDSNGIHHIVLADQKSALKKKPFNFVKLKG